MKTSSCKAKGRKACQEAKDLLHKYAPDLRPGDIEITSSGACGEDLKLSPAAREKYPLVVEVKSQESIQIWAALEQAESHGIGHPDQVPVLFFRRNRSELYVALLAEDFVKLIS
jgi:hypothetical protein